MNANWMASNTTLPLGKEPDRNNAPYALAGRESVVRESLPTVLVDSRAC